jgi:tryptophanyl-tRNA synthetase
MTDDADTVALKIRKAKTDPHPLPGPEVLKPDGTVDRPGRPSAPRSTPAGHLRRPFGQVAEGAVAEFAGREFSFFKQVLTDLAVATIGQMGNEMKRLLPTPPRSTASCRDGRRARPRHRRPHPARGRRHRRLSCALMAARPLRWAIRGIT